MTKTTFINTMPSGNMNHLSTISNSNTNTNNSTHAYATKIGGDGASGGASGGGTGSSSLPSPTSPSPSDGDHSALHQLLFLLHHHNNPTAQVIDDPSKLTVEDRTRLSSELEELKSLVRQAQENSLQVHASIQQFQQLVLSTHAQVAAAKQSLIQARGTMSNSSSFMNSGPCSPTGSATGTGLRPRGGSLDMGQARNGDRHASRNGHENDYENGNRNGNETRNLYSNASSRASSSSSPGSPMSMPSRSRSDSFSSHPFLSTYQHDPYHHHHDDQQHQHHLHEGIDEEEDMTEELRLRRLSQEHAELGCRLSSLLMDKASAEDTKKKLNDGMNKAKARIKDLERVLGE
ncbi:hypothetical protein EDD11_004676 [Mortierella claussenii]|nr:hypothetical protein EDD11_004676 [Mortierella claussenii]